ncbi:MAG: hypothetical protein QM723_20475 [Myxococcaceae bacterium]
MLTPRIQVDEAVPSVCMPAIRAYSVCRLDGRTQPSTVKPLDGKKAGSLGASTSEVPSKLKALPTSPATVVEVPVSEASCPASEMSNAVGD